jgi:hypothetical protein
MSDSQRAKSRHQHPMSNSPILLARERSEEAVVDAMSDLLEGAGDFLGEAILVAEFGSEGYRVDENRFAAEKGHQRGGRKGEGEASHLLYATPIFRHAVAIGGGDCWRECLGRGRGDFR